MAKDLLAAIGARIEAQLTVKGAHSRSIEDTVKTRVSKNPPAPFTLLADDARQLGYAPTTDTQYAAPESMPETLADGNFGSPLPGNDAPTSEDISAAIAPFAVLLNNPVSVLKDSAPLPSEAAQVAVTAANVSTEVAPAVEEVAPASLSFAERIRIAMALPEIAPAPSAPAAAAPASAPAAATAAKAADVAPHAEVINRVPNVPEPVTAEWGVGATFRRKGVLSDPPMTVCGTGDGFILADATFVGAEGNGIWAFIPNQLELITRAPGS